jgi:hypothetical protein
MAVTRLIDLLKRVPRQDREAVVDAKKRFAGPARELVRDLTRFSLVPRKSDKGRGSKAEIRIEVEDGHPEALESIVLEEDLEVLALLLEHHEALVDVANGGEGLSSLSDALARLPLGRALLCGREQAIPPVQSLVEDLLRRLRSVDVARRILWIDEDVLGVYRYPANVPGGLFGSSTGTVRTTIVLYWAPIALLAKALPAPVAAVTAVVLLHELGHAFSHVGLDSEDRRWATDAFSKAEHGLIEGIAQYCSHVLVGELERDVPGVGRAYEEVLERQSEAYRTHLGWVEPPAEEAFRRALLSVRRTGIGSLEEFEAERMAGLDAVP